MIFVRRSSDGVHKFVAVVPDGHRVRFGREGYSDYTLHKDPERMCRYLARHRALTWPTVKWAGGVVPTQTASGTDVYTFIKRGANVFGSVVQAMA